MTVIALAFYLGVIPVPPSPIHTQHYPPANPQLALAPRCKVVEQKTSKNGLLVVKIKVCK